MKSTNISRAFTHLTKHCGLLATAVALLTPFNDCDAQKEAVAVQNVTPIEAQKLIADKQVVVLDVRTPAEFAAGHIAGAVNVDFQAADFEQKIGTLDKTKRYVVHCRSGHRSQQALPLLEKQGFASLYHLDGGMLSWEKAGLPVEK